MASGYLGLITQCASYIGITAAELLSISATAPNRYFVWSIPKRSGGRRLVCHPARELKPVQTYFLHHVLQSLPVHASAVAYVKGSSIKRNALEHAASRVILKLDFSDFFNSVKADDWRKYAADHFPAWSAVEVDFSTRVLFWGNRSNTPKCLAVGAPSSPLLSNILMYQLDTKLHSYAAGQGMTYTRYADDITFSSTSSIDKVATVETVKRALRDDKYTNILLNERKTKLVSNGFQRRVTGLIITPDHRVSLGRDRKRVIRAMCHHYCTDTLPYEKLPHLRGLLAFAQDIEPAFVLTLRNKYGSEKIDQIVRPRGHV